MKVHVSGSRCSAFGARGLLERRLAERTLSRRAGAVAIASFLCIPPLARTLSAALPAPVEGQGLHQCSRTPVPFHRRPSIFGYVGFEPPSHSRRRSGHSRPIVRPSPARCSLGARRVDRPHAGKSCPLLLAYYLTRLGRLVFWYPVENASLMPWLAAPALLHLCHVPSAPRDCLRAWTGCRRRGFLNVHDRTFLVRSES